jgi:GntR family transcriptional repressor for pyruvate dehydrogenase complex
MEFKPLKRISLSEQISEQLKEKIIKGEFKPGDKLPSENELCNIYGVSRTAVRQALNTLASIDLIETKFGGGSYVKQPNSGNVLNGLIPHTFLNEKSMLEIIEFRRILEANVAYLSCRRATKSDVETLKNIYDDMVKNKDDLTTFSKLDYDFHIAIAKISGNSYVIKIYEIIAEVLLSAFSDIVSKRGNEAGLTYHAQILAAFESGNAAAAKDAMQHHMDDLYEEYSK